MSKTFISFFIVVISSQVFAEDELQFSIPKLRRNLLRGAPNDPAAAETTVVGAETTVAGAETTVAGAATTVAGAATEVPSATTKKTAARKRPVDYSRLEVRVGKIISIQEIVTAHNLYVEEVDVGEAITRTVVRGGTAILSYLKPESRGTEELSFPLTDKIETVSALVNQIPMEELENRRVVVLCNVRPRKIVGYVSEGMLICAVSNDTVEVLEPPFGSLPGERIIVEGYESKPDRMLNHKDKVFETVSLDMRVNEKRVATYKGKPLFIKDKGNITAETLRDAHIA